MDSSRFTGALAERTHKSKKKEGRKIRRMNYIFLSFFFFFSAFFLAANPIKADLYGHSKVTNKACRNFSLPELWNMSSLDNMFLKPLSYFHGSCSATIQFLIQCIPFFFFFLKVTCTRRVLVLLRALFLYCMRRFYNTISFFFFSFSPLYWVFVK